MELVKYPVLGCGLLASALCMDKYRAHQLVKAAGIKVTRSVLVHNINDFNVKALNFPLFVKPLKKLDHHMELVKLSKWKN